MKLSLFALLASMSLFSLSCSLYQSEARKCLENSDCLASSGIKLASLATMNGESCRTFDEGEPTPFDFGDWVEVKNDQKGPLVFQLQQWPSLLAGIEESPKQLASMTAPICLKEWTEFEASPLPPQQMVQKMRTFVESKLSRK